MASNITLSAGVRQNLLSLQETSFLIGLVQNRLATGKTVNTALDNPGNFFTSQSLQNRAGDLNSLLDNINQAQQSLDAASKGISSITKLVESAKSVAKQAQQAALGAQVAYNAFTVAGSTPTAETLAVHSGAAITVANTTTYSFDININGTGAVTVTYTSDGSATLAEIQAGLIADFDAKVATKGFSTSNITLTATGSGVQVNAVSADSDYVITNNSNAGLTNNTYNSTSLLDNISTSGTTLTLAINGGANQVITFGTGVGEVSTLAELNSTLGAISSLAAGSGANGTAVTFKIASTDSQNSINITSSAAALTTALGLTGKTGTTQGTATVTGPDPTRASLEADFNDIVAQIDTLASDASYNGVNLLGGDTLKVSFNETGTSSLSISGVTFNASGLGLAAVGSGTFQSNGNIDLQVAKLDTALTTLRNQASKFGSSLTTVQTRQDFTKNLISTLQTGADNLVLADTNEEGANLLALQTRQSLSSTALSLSATADRAVLRLFGA